ncbi:MAG: hypothetical protein EOS72_20575 [Mesorhizobium sp.]|uniref:hypothetical protein n=1 Tax=Mesorhizobium sp. TaxID=1871066 RepID=UPI000FE7FB9A|nr:hypothetical protein [Mesorhizobium sp.]RWC87643.1 MAG: hypothetical protein EOS72_20575 [Mesorhizobium sp.]
MPEVLLVTTANRFALDSKPGMSLLEIFRQNNIPIQGTLTLDENKAFVSLTHVLRPDDRLTAYAMRNVDFRCVQPTYTVVPTDNPVAEIVRPLKSPFHLGIVQFTRPSAMNYIYDSVSSALSRYAETREDRLPIQVALSPGGDGRVLVECIRRYWDENPDEQFHAIIVAVGFEDEQEHLSAGIALAEKYRIPYDALNTREAADILGYESDLESLSKSYRSTFPEDEAEIMLTYWVQNVNFELARRGGRRGILFGYNQEDVIAERLYQVMTGRLLPPLPIRRLDEHDVIAPLAQIPKKLLDAMDIDNSLRNYNIRSASVSYTRSSLYLLSYIVAEQFPSIADVMSGGFITPNAPNEILDWLKGK